MKSLIGILFLISSFSVSAAIEISKVSEIKRDGKSVLRFRYSGVLRESPSLSQIGSNIKFVLKGALKSKSSYKSFIDHERIFVPSYNADQLVLNVKKSMFSKGETLISIKKDYFEIIYPSLKLKKAMVEASPKKKVVNLKKKPVKTFQKKVLDTSKTQKNLDYLVENLRKESLNEKKSELSSADWLEDKVEVTQGSIDKKIPSLKVESLKGDLKGENLLSDKPKKTEFSFSNYATKVVLVLAGIILVFYFSVNIFRKKVMKGNQLGFLKSNQLIEVIGKTHVGPKKSILLVRAHDQYLLLSDSDSGIRFLTEVKDAAGLLRMGEKNVKGDNFEEKLTSSEMVNNLESNVKMKDLSNIYESSNPRSLKVKELRKKFKKGRSFQAKA